jgi:ABC-2 type transport system ATP-binding protein
VFIAGNDLARGAHLLKRRIGYLPEELYLYNRLSGSEYLQLVAGLKDADPATVAGEIEFFELSEVANKWIGGYSLGMRKKLGLAAAMIARPDVLVLDEPLNGLDVEMMRKLRERIETERKAGRAILFSSHVMSFVERISNRIGIMSAGRLVAEGSPRELRDRASLADAPFEDVFFKLAS